jgi:hypothetical protein
VHDTRHVTPVVMCVAQCSSAYVAVMCALVQVGTVRCDNMTQYNEQQVSKLPLKATAQAVI